MATATTQSRIYQPLLLALGIVFAALTILYSAAWMYYVRRPLPVTQVEIGINAFYSSAGVEIDDVHPNGPAEEAGLKRKDLIVAINGSNADSESEWNRLENRTWLRAQPGDTVTLTVRRPGQSQPLVFTPWFRAKQGAGDT
jgi:S1-C subfamily serine protease